MKKEINIGENNEDVCNRDGCKGIFEYEDIDGCCSCHIYLPCGYCERKHDLICPECDYSSREELDKVFAAIQKHKMVNPKPVQKPMKEPDGLYRVARYFDDHFECWLCAPINYSKAVKVRNQAYSNARKRNGGTYYVFYQIKEVKE